MPVQLTMTLHEAIEKLLLQTRQPMTAREIADALNKNKWYSKGDKSEIKPSQVTARVDDHHELFDIDRSVSPLKVKLFGRQLKPFVKVVSGKVEARREKDLIKPVSDHLKTSFPPLSDNATTILILGTMPGEQSLKLGEYYGHPRNRFWKIIAAITSNELPVSYGDKKRLLIQSTIGLWDVAHKATRKGSLDSAIESEEPNDLQSFISKHKNLKVIGFNGAKAETLFDRYFTRRSDIQYISLPSSSPANTGINIGGISSAWRKILHK